MRWFVVFSILIFGSACKVEISPPVSGSVESVSGAFNCSADSPCIIDVVDYYFDETFLPRAKPGQAFTGWTSGDNSLCGGRLDNCSLRTLGLKRSAALTKILDGDETFLLTPRFASHAIEAFDGEWFGELLGNSDADGRENESVVIALEGNGISIIEQRWSERTQCDYSGRFEVVTDHSRRAKEAIAGTYTCSGATAHSGQFSAYIYAITDHQIILEMTVFPSGGDKRITVSVLHRDNFLLRETLARAAEVPGGEFTADHLGSYEANQVMSGSTCAAFPAEDSHASFKISGQIGSLSIKTDVLGGSDCEFTQNTSARLLGTYRCNDGSQGLWETDDLRVHETPHGSLVSMELRRMGHFCEILHLAGWRAGSSNH
ncbi:MAG: hypothetical protein ABJL54_00795 [Halioglobus sp.]